jgi:hypothetical protein
LPGLKINGFDYLSVKQKQGGEFPRPVFPVREGIAV